LSISLRAPGGGGGALLSVSDLSCAGAFRTVAVGLQVPGGNYPVAMRYESGARHYFMMDGITEDIKEFPEPTLSNCSTAIGSMNQASLEGWGGNWGAYQFGAAFDAGQGCDVVPGCNGSGLLGLRFDGAGHLTAGWSGNYAAIGVHNSFASMTLNNVAHTLSTNGCWGLSGLTQPYVGGAVITIPAAFVAANLPSGHNVGVTGGWPFATVGAGISEGPTLYAIAPPSTTLEQFTANGGGGPTCSNDVNYFVIGCTPAITTISAPYPKQIAYTTYSRATYSTDWEPYPVGAPTHGWAGFLSYGSSDWYDDGVKRGVVTALVTPEGWINETVSSSTSATNFVASATSTHDGLNMNVGDIIQVQTCTVGVDPGCNGDQSHFSSQARITSINTSTHAVGMTVTSQDGSSGNHFPVPGGPVSFGCFYSFGTPTCSRWEIRMQIDDPSDLALVAGGSTQPYAVVAADDEEIDQTLITSFGSPTSGSGANFNAEQEAGPSSVIADTTGHNIIVAFIDYGNPTSDVIYVLHIAEPMPDPMELLGAFGVICLLSLAGWGRLTRRVS
jgi:hypothetical protein